MYIFELSCFHIVTYLLISDVVHAYKNLNKEKEALEASVNALSAVAGAQQQQKQQSLAPTGNNSDGEGGKQQEEIDDPLGVKDQVRTEPLASLEISQREPGAICISKLRLVYGDLA